MNVLGFCLVLAFCLSGCGSGANHSSSNNQSNSKTSATKTNRSPVPETKIPLHQRVARAKIARLTCADSVCHPNTVMLSGVSPQGVMRCSGVLLAPDLVLTNDHCLHAPLAVGNGSCKGLLFAHTLFNESLECEAVQFHSKESGVDSEDYAVVRFKQSAAHFEPILLSKRGLSSGEPVRIDRVQMVSSIDGSIDGSLDGQVQRVTCLARHQTFLYPAVKSADFPLMTFTSCPIQGGNSGAPIYNQAGELAAVLQGYFDIPDEVYQMPEIKNSGKMPRDFRISVGTQTHCMSSHALNNSLSASDRVPPTSHCLSLERALIRL